MSSTATKDLRLSPRTSNESNDTISLMSLSTHQNIQQSILYQISKMERLIHVKKPQLKIQIEYKEIKY